MLAGGNDQHARLWSMNTSKVVHTFVGHDKKLSTSSFTWDSESVLTGSYDRTVRVWDVKTGSQKKVISAQSAINYLCVSPNHSLFATAHLDNHVRVWSLNSSECMHDFDELHTQQATGVEFSKEGTLMLSTSRDNTVKLVDVRTYKTLFELTGTTKCKYTDYSFFNDNFLGMSRHNIHNISGKHC